MAHLGKKHFLWPMLARSNEAVLFSGLSTMSGMMVGYDLPENHHGGSGASHKACSVGGELCTAGGAEISLPEVDRQEVGR